jgi:nitrogen fixation protein FixH
VFWFLVRFYDEEYYTMTEFYEAVEQQREILELEKQAKQIVAIDTRYKDGLWYKQTVDYADGRRITEYRDKRRATIEENRYGEDVD